MQKWEYATVRGIDEDHLVEKMNKLGVQGWELLSVTQVETDFTAFLKRAI